MQETRRGSIQDNRESLFQLGGDYECGRGRRRDECGGESRKAAVDPVESQLGPEMGDQRNTCRPEADFPNHDK